MDPKRCDSLYGSVDCPLYRAIKTAEVDMLEKEVRLSSALSLIGSFKSYSIFYNDVMRDCRPGSLDPGSGCF